MSTWNIDPVHSTAEFTVRHMMISKVRGQFAGPTGTITFDAANPAAASVEASVDASTVDTQVADRNNHLKSADFFDVETYPTITFKSTAVESVNDTHAKVSGDLTIKGVTKPVVLDAEFYGVQSNPQSDHAGFYATTVIDREDFGLTWNMALEAGGVLVSKEVTLELSVQAIHQK